MFYVKHAPSGQYAPNLNTPATQTINTIFALHYAEPKAQTTYGEARARSKRLGPGWFVTREAR